MENTRIIRRIVNLPTIKGISPVNNYCLLQRLTDNFNDTTEAGVYKASEQLNLNQYLASYANRVYKVIAKPDRLVLYNNKNKTSGVGAWWDTDIQIEIGDIVWTSYPSVLDVDVIRTPQEEYYLIKYQELRMAKRKESYMMLNGWNLYKRVEKKTDSIIVDPNVRKHIDHQVGEIVRVGNPNRLYHRTNKKTKKSCWKDLDQGIELSEGEVFVKADKAHELILENPEFAVYPEKDVYLIQRKDIVSIINY